MAARAPASAGAARSRGGTGARPGRRRRIGRPARARARGAGGASWRLVTRASNLSVAARRAKPRRLSPRQEGRRLGLRVTWSALRAVVVPALDVDVRCRRSRQYRLTRDDRNDEVKGAITRVRGSRGGAV